MGAGPQIVIPVEGDWTTLRNSLARLAGLGVGPESTPTFAGLTITGLTPSRLLSTDADDVLSSVSDLTAWIAGTTNQITVADDSDGTVTLSLPQDIHTGASPTFTDLTLSAPSNIYALSHDAFAGFEANEHIDHSGVSVIAGTGLSGGGTIDGNVTLNCDITQYTDEHAQDAIGTILSDSSSIDFTYDDGTPSISAVVLPAGVDHDSLLNFAANEHIDHTTVTLTAGVGLSGGGDISTNRTFDLDLTELTEDTSPSESQDYVVTYDGSASAHKKVKISNLPGGGGTVSNIDVLNVQLLAFKVLTEHDLPRQGMVKGLTDALETDGGVDRETSEHEFYVRDETYDPLVDIQENQEDHTGSTGVGDVSGVEHRVAQRFQLDGEVIIAGASIYFGTKVGSPTGGVTYRIETDDNGPTGVLADAGLTATVSSPTDDAWNTVEYDNIVLSAGTYWLVTSCSAQAVNDRWIVGWEYESSYDRGLAAKSFDSGTSWDLETYKLFDLGFRIYGAFRNVFRPDDIELNYEAWESTGTAPIGDYSGTEYRVAQSFTLSDTTPIDGVSIRAGTTIGTPTGDLTVRIETDSSGPTGTLAHANATATIANADWEDSNFNRVDYSSFSLAAGTYWIVVTVAAQAANNYWTWYGSSLGSYSDGQRANSTDGGATWSLVTHAAWDMWFRVHTTGVKDMTLVSTPWTAGSEPSTIRLTLFENEVDSVTLNTDLIGYVSRDGGATWEAISLSDYGEYLPNKHVLSGAADVSGQPSGTSIMWKLVTANNKDLKIHGIGLNWE